MLQDPPRVLYLPLAPSQQLPTPQQHQLNCESRESSRNSSSSTASQTGSRRQHRTFQQLQLGRHGTKPPQGQFCAVPATNAGPEEGQQSCPWQLQHHPANPPCPSSVSNQPQPPSSRRDLPGHDGAAGAAQPQPGLPAGTGGTRWSHHGSPQQPLAQCSAKGGPREP